MEEDWSDLIRFNLVFKTIKRIKNLILIAV